MNRIFKFDRTMKNGMFAGAALGVLTAVVLGVGSSMGAELVSIPGPEEQGADYGWRDDFDGYRRYYGADGMVLTNTITPDGQYVDETGVWFPRQYDVSRFTSIPADAKSLLVIEGHGKAARATFYVKEEKGTEAAGQQSEAGGQQNIFLGPGAAGQAAGDGAAAPADRAAQAGQAAQSEQITQAGQAAQAEQAAQAADQAVREEQAGVQGGSAESGPAEQWKMLFDVGGYVGKNGIGKVQEGDEKSPRGLYTLDEAFGTKPDPGNFNVPYLQVNDGHYWVGDSNSPLYNTLVDIRQTGEVFNTAASEHLSTYGGKAYYYCMAVGYNKERTPYKGSAIFLHCTDGPGTGGCIAIPEEAMVTVLQNIEQPAYILIDDGENLSGY